MCSLLGDLAGFEHENSVRGSNRRQTVRDQDRGLPSVPSFDRGEDLVLGAGVDRAQGVIENEDVRSLDQRAGDGDSLSLSPGERESPFADHGLVSLIEALDRVVDAGIHRRRLDGIVLQIRSCDRDVVADRS